MIGIGPSCNRDLIGIIASRAACKTLGPKIAIHGEPNDREFVIDWLDKLVDWGTALRIRDMLEEHVQPTNPFSITIRTTDGDLSFELQPKQGHNCD